MIINHYLIREISRPLLVILGILVTLFGSYSAATFLSDAVNGLLPANTIAALIALKVLISLEVLIPISLYIAVILAFGKLYRDAEFTAMFALRVTPARVMGAVLTLSAYLAIMVALLSLFVRPIAYQKLHELSDRAQFLLNIDNMAAGTFYIGDKGRRAIFLTHRDGPGTPARDVFVQLRRGNQIQLVYARFAFPIKSESGKGGSEVFLRDAHMYEFGNEDEQSSGMLTAQGIVLDPNNHTSEPPEYSSVATGTARLLKSDLPADVAEFQWRLSTAVSTLLLGMLAVPLSRAQPRQSRYAKIGTAILIYSGYYLLCTSARTWVQHSAVPPFPGIWWVPALLALILVAAIYQPFVAFRFSRRPV